MSKTKIIGLGGFKEIGKSTLIIEHENSIVIIDSGIKFADSATTGLNGMIPNYQYLKENESKIEALLITHGHEDHLGGVTFLVRQVNIKKIFAPKIAIEYLKYKFKDQNVNVKVEFIEIKAEDKYKLGTLTVDFWTAQHSIPDAFGIRVSSPEGKLLMTGDYRFDYTPITNMTDFDKLKQIGDEGLTVLLSDSTNAMRSGHSPSEKDILKDIEKIIVEAKRKIIVTGFASNLTRMKEILLLGVKHNKKIAIFGRSMVNGIEIGRKLGYLNVDDSVFINKKEMNQYEDNEIMVLTTGSQGEELAALSRMSYGKHHQIKIMHNDVIIFSSSPIPGNRMKIELLINRLYKLGAIIKENGVDGYLHTSGHAYIDEHIKTFKLSRPKYFMPYHGDYRMEVFHGQTAIECGVKEENIIIPDAGQIVYMEKGELTISDERIDVRPIYIDGGTVLTESQTIVSERNTLGQNGFVTAVICINKKLNRIINRPKLISKGSLFIRKSQEFIETANKLVHSSVLYTIKNKFDKKTKKPTWTVEELEKLIIDRLRVFFHKEKRRRPIIIPVILIKEDEDDPIIALIKNELSKDSSYENNQTNSKNDKKDKTKKPNLSQAKETISKLRKSLNLFDNVDDNEEEDD
ncbi:ribonuclease J [Mycoplasma testudineum]|uniref:Ribonuclease J n=1 Tax=Mycoplasma testudineum TaxID=244584 RepID=A0A4R6IBX6_9MOLU|nr:ribonuclease J [Mycoplasma testudineum]OYD26600.1 RNase J family beta-CASP ribonuclease [Mycoplasma testudineum]TDO19432.1 ribonuclease J [Mycoplasma testudineum]